MPKRIQRKRTKWWRMPPNTVYVGRPTQYGNPYRGVSDKELRRAVEDFREYAESVLTGEPGWLAPLRGKDLACWCPLDRPCHADVLLEIANKGASDG